MSVIKFCIYSNINIYRVFEPERFVCRDEAIARKRRLEDDNYGVSYYVDEIRVFSKDKDYYIDSGLGGIFSLEFDRVEGNTEMDMKFYFKIINKGFERELVYDLNMIHNVKDKD